MGQDQGSRERVTVALVNGWGPLCTPCLVLATKNDLKASVAVRKIKPTERLCVSCSRPLRVRAAF